MMIDLSLSLLSMCLNKDMDRLATISAGLTFTYVYGYDSEMNRRVESIVNMTHCMMNVALMTSNDDIESSSSRTTTNQKTIRKTRTFFYTAGILNEKLTCSQEMFRTNERARIYFVTIFDLNTPIANMLQRFPFVFIEIQSCRCWESLWYFLVDPCRTEDNSIRLKNSSIDQEVFTQSYFSSERDRRRQRQTEQDDIFFSNQSSSAFVDAQWNISSSLPLEVKLKFLCAPMGRRSSACVSFSFFFLRTMRIFPVSKHNSSRQSKAEREREK